MSYVQISALENELSRVAEEKIQEFVGPQEGETLEVAVPVITVTKEYILFGKTTGKVTLYMRRVENVAAEDRRDAPRSFGRGHEHSAGGISGLEFFLAKEGGAWLDLESNTCGSEQCQIEGKAAFERGTHVPATAAGE